MINVCKTLVLLSIVWLCACNQSTHNTKSTQDDVADFVGCYTINPHLPAQIKISQQNDHYVMQMKEPAGSSSVWDKPELLNVVKIDDAWKFFSVNALELNKSDIQAVLARPDNIMVLAKVKSASKNINPMLDSEFLVYIFRGSNTIYQVPCDETPMDIVPQ